MHSIISHCHCIALFEQQKGHSYCSKRRAAAWSALPLPHHHNAIITQQKLIIRLVNNNMSFTLTEIFMAMFVWGTTGGREIGGPMAVCVLGCPPTSHPPGCPGSPAVQPEWWRKGLLLTTVLFCSCSLSNHCQKQLMATTYWHMLRSWPTTF